MSLPKCIYCETTNISLEDVSLDAPFFYHKNYKGIPLAVIGEIYFVCKNCLGEHKRFLRIMDKYLTSKDCL